LRSFLACDGDQELLLLSSLRDWLPEGHLAWCVIDAVAQFDLSAFYADYRDDGHGRSAHDPAMMVTRLLVEVQELDAHPSGAPAANFG
jgi:hypothetical protein